MTLIPRPARFNYWTDVLALTAGVVVFATGLILFTRFHVAEGSFRLYDWGLSRLAWINIHRLAAVLLLGAVMVHVERHWRPMVVRMGRAMKRLPGGASRAELVLYAGFAVVSLAALAAWFVVPGSPAVAGPITLTHQAPIRHRWIDIHNLSGLVLLPAVVVHIRRHLRWMLCAGRLARRTSPCR
ncbi:MAG: DUF4405 domain-containing protein [Bryobacteraceae bacterium]